MRRITLSFALVLVAGVPVMAQESAAQVAERLGAQIVVRAVSQSGTSVEWGEATGVVNAPVDHVLQIIKDYGSYDQFLPKFSESRVLATRGHTSMVYLEAVVAKGAATFWAQVRIEEKPQQGDTRIIEAHMVRGNVERFSAQWHVRPLDQGSRTLVRFRILVDPDMPLPSSIFSSENYKAARRTLKALRRRVVHVAQRPTQLAQNT